MISCMTEIDVLVVESTAGAARREVDALTAAGHQVHLCHEPTDDGFACRSLVGDGCPLDGGIDVGLVVRPRVAPRPSHREQGVGCMLRAGIPVVEEGPPVLDPYEPFLAGRVRGNVVAACTEAAEHAFDPLRDDIVSRVAHLVAAAGCQAEDIDVQIDRRGPDLRVQIDGPDVPSPIRSAMAVRALDAVRASGRTFGQVDVGYCAR